MRGLRAVAALLALALIAAACADNGNDDNGDPGAPEAEASIDIAGFAFSGPATVSAGTTVTVENQDGVAHTWTAQDRTFDSGSLSQGETFEFTFTEAGEFEYFCSIHPEMTGSITVTG